jgi:hypothetical protein
MLSLLDWLPSGREISCMIGIYGSVDFKDEAQAKAVKRHKSSSLISFIVGNSPLMIRAFVIGKLFIYISPIYLIYPCHCLSIYLSTYHLRSFSSLED